MADITYSLEFRDWENRMDPAMGECCVLPPPAQPFDPVTVTTVTAAGSRELSLRDRRKKPRTLVPSMYSQVTVRVLNKRREPIEGYAVNLSESGMAVELDELIPPGSPVAIEFTVSGLGRQRMTYWPAFVATGEVVRNQDVEDFPGGPYRTALRFTKIPTIAQAEIARYVTSHAVMKV